MKIVFFGTPDFAVATLQKLIENKFDVVGVVTAPDKPAGRGQQINYSAVKVFALEKGVHIMQPISMKDDSFCEALKNLNADIQIVVAFRMMPEKVWNMPPLGTMNLHGSLLPQYRGAAPINWAIINGEKITGVTTFLLKHEIDTGNILMRKEVDIMPEDDFGTMYEKLKSIGADLVVASLNKIITGNYTEISQEEFGFPELINAPKIYKELGKINPKNDVESVHNLIRGLSPIPAAYIEFDDKSNKPAQLKIFKTTFETNVNSVAGGFVTDNKTFLKYGCINGLLNILELQLQGKKRMKVDEFLRGYKF